MLVAVSRGPVRMFRNSVGRGWVGTSVKIERAGTIAVQPGDVVVRKARPLHAGLATGSGDLIGWRSVEVTPGMVGLRVAVFVSLEAKQGSGRLEPEQRAWLDTVRNGGGIAAEVRSLDDARAALELPFVGKP